MMKNRSMWLTAALLLLSFALASCTGGAGLDLENVKETVEAVREDAGEEFEDQIKDLEKEIEDKDDDIADLEDENEDLQGEVDDLKDEVAAIKESTTSDPEDEPEEDEPLEEDEPEDEDMESEDSGAELAPRSGVTYEGEKQEIHWFVGLGTGSNEGQKAAQLQAVDEFNEANSDVELTIEFVDNNVAVDTLSTYIAAGTPPDIVGPVGINGSNIYIDNWLDLEPIVEEMGYDLGQFPPESVDVYRSDDKLSGLPFAAFPAVVFYSRELFDKAGLEYPPQEFGEDYADGDTWDFDKVRELAMLMTFDENGNDATSDDFDQDAVEQWGFIHQWADDTRAVGHNWGPANMFDEDDNAVLPDSYREGLAWTYDGIWSDGFHPSTAYLESEFLTGEFASGKIAMALTMQWYTCCLTADFEWDLAVVPSVDGTYTSKLHNDTFRIMDYDQSDEKKQAAFSVLSFLVGEASPDLLQVYGGMPVRPSETDAFFDGLDDSFPFNVNWDVSLASLAYNDTPSHEGWMPNLIEARQVSQEFWALIQSDGELDLDDAFDEFLDDLQDAFDG